MLRRLSFVKRTGYLFTHGTQQRRVGCIAVDFSGRIKNAKKRSNLHDAQLPNTGENKRILTLCHFPVR